jgi:hypothetical protein
VCVCVCACARARVCVWEGVSVRQKDLHGNTGCVGMEICVGISMKIGYTRRVDGVCGDVYMVGVCGWVAYLCESGCKFVCVCVCVCVLCVCL